MDPFPERLVAEALALSRARGADLLVRLGDYDLWRGDLGEMRGDSPRTTMAPREPANAAPLTDALLMARAIELLPLTCRAALAAANDSRKDTTDRIDCRKRLLDIFTKLCADRDATTPDWVAEREHAGIDGRDSK